MRKPRASSSAPIDAAAIPLPSPETTPPVTKMYLVLIGHASGWLREFGAETAARFGLLAGGESGAGCGEEACACEHAAHERSPRLLFFSQFMFDARNILGAIDAEVRPCGLNDPDFKAVLQRSQLFQRFRQFERRRRERGEGFQDIRLIAVHPDMPLRAGERRTGEVKCIAGECSDYLDDVARLPLVVVLDTRCECGHVDAGLLQDFDDGIDRVDVDERLVALDVDDLIVVVLEQIERCSDAIGAALK